ncbi:MAG: glycosyltransferase [Flavobacterium sp.]|nr:MAG: glycosyltransferase [Flavobacterium sp.]
MLSVLIPTYDYDACALATEMYRQCKANDIPFEIICRDDASDSPLIVRNQEINALENCSFDVNPVNLGRGRNINSMAAEAQYDWLLILDCDMFPTSPHFIAQYLSLTTEPGLEIVYGGIKYHTDKPAKNQLLRWVYGHEREAVPHEKREQDRFTATLTSNLLVRRKLLLTHPFSGEIKEYGYEDLVFTTTLAKSGVRVRQADNPAYHLNLETSAIFLGKTKAALRNLRFLMDKEMLTEQESVVIRTFRKIRKFGLNHAVAFFYKLSEPLLRSVLLSPNPSLFLFDIYKIGYFCSIKKSR